MFDQMKLSIRKQSRSPNENHVDSLIVFEASMLHFIIKLKNNADKCHRQDFLEILRAMAIKTKICGSGHNENSTTDFEFPMQIFLNHRAAVTELYDIFNKQMDELMSMCDFLTDDDDYLTGDLSDIEQTSIESKTNSMIETILTDVGGELKCEWSI